MDELFVFLMDSTSKYEQEQVLSLITQVLQSCQRIQTAAHLDNIDKAVDTKVVETAAQKVASSYCPC